RPGDVLVRDAVTGKVLLAAALPGHVAEDAALSPDGRRVVTVLIDAKTGARDVRLWDVRTGKGTPLQGHGFPARHAAPAEAVDPQKASDGDSDPPEYALLFTPDGRTLVTANPPSVARFRLWEAASGRALTELRKGWRVSLSEDGASVLS